MDVLCAGEALVDFLPLEPGRAVKDVSAWRPCLGGSPANVAVGVARLGGSSAMLGVVGRDEMGDFLRERLAAEGVDVSHLRQTTEGKTGLVFISLTERGERSFAHFRTSSAERFLSPADVDAAFVSRARAVHCGTNSLLLPRARHAMVHLFQGAAARGQIACCDPNLRLEVWDDPRVLQETLHLLFPLCSVVKLAEDEIEPSTGERTPEGAIRALERLGVALPVVTLGARGAMLSFAGRRFHVPAPAVKVVDTTGAGDGFVSALLHGLTRRCRGRADLALMDPGEVRELGALACRAASRVCERLGAVDGLPRASEMEGPWPAPPGRREGSAQGETLAGQKPEEGPQRR